MIPALLIRTSMCGIEGSERIVCAAARTLVNEERKRGMYITVVVGDMRAICPLTGWIW